MLRFYGVVCCKVFKDTRQSYTRGYKRKHALAQGRVSITLAAETEALAERVFRKRLVPIEG